MTTSPVFIDLSGTPLDELWDMWQKSHSAPVRQALIRRYSLLADRVCSLVSSQGSTSRFEPRRSPVAMRRYANAGLATAIEDFNLDAGHVFEMFAVPRIKQAILDGMAAGTIAEQSLRPPQVSPLHRALTLDGPDRCDIGSMLADDEDSDRDSCEHETERSIVGGQLRQRFLLLLEPLPDRQRRILRHYYIDGLTPTQIARTLEVDVGVVMTAHALALETIRRQVTGESHSRFED